MSLAKLHQIEDIFEKRGNIELATACKAIVGSDGGNGIGKSIDEDAMKETIGTSKVIWLKHKIIILEHQEEFKNECQQLGLNPDDFLKEINEEVMKVEASL